MKIFVITFLIVSPLLLSGQPDLADDASDWSSVIHSREGTVVFYWYPARPFIYTEDKGMSGIEYELTQSFLRFLQSEYKVNLNSKWVKANKFDDVINDMQGVKSGVFGVSSLSITPDRLELINFAPPYIPDITVLVTSPNVTIAKTKDEFHKVVNGLTAVTVSNSTYERDVLNLRNMDGIDFDIQRVDNAGDIVANIETMDDGFGYIDLPSFLVALREGTTVKRQFFYPNKLEGFGLAFSKNSDWNEPVKAYFDSEVFKEDRQRIVAKYLGQDVTELIETISNSVEIGPYEEIVLLAQERELQYKELLEAAEKARKDQRWRNILIGGIIIFLLVALLFYTRYQVKAKSNRKLAEKQRQLAELNKEKYNLIKVIDYDLRASITRISGLARLYILENDPLTEDQQKIIEHILHTSDQLGGVIGNVLNIDAAEGEMALKFDRIDLNDSIESVIADLRNLAEELGVSIEWTHADFKAVVNGDKPSLKLILENLLTNAIETSGRDSVVSIDLVENEGKVLVSVKDQGEGFSEEDRGNIFSQPDSAVGMGLSIVKMYTDLMKGTISCESELGKGSTFILSLNKA